MALAMALTLSASPLAYGEKVTSNTLGIQIQVPDGTQVTGKNAAGEPPYLLFRDGGAAPRWSLRLEQLESNQSDARNLLIELLGSHQEADRDFNVVSQSQVAVGKGVA